ncbi:MAG: hypothetical protein AAGH15_04160 [Myxococcota bacterium]
MRRVVCLALALGLVGCGDGDGGPSDLVPPEFRDVRATLQGDLATEIDLSGEDQVFVLPSARTFAFSVFVRDDVSAAADMSVSVRVNGAAGTPSAAPTFESGLWRFELEVGPGESVEVVVADEAGNETLGPAMLVVPSREEAVVGTWEQAFFDDGQRITGRFIHVLSAMGDYTRRDGEDEDRGSYSVDATTLGLTLVATTESSAYYVDNVFLAPGPWTRTDGNTGIVGAWTVETTLGGETTTRTLIVGDDDTWSERVETGGTLVEETSGTYRTELNEDYVESIGEFFIRSVTERDGSPVTEEPLAELFVLREGLLLLAPWTRD